ncbi:DUF2279 domain-containing protein [Flavobacterium sp. UMI-01]|uniref:DUF2279 domain-containing protein n=1 Tax=Flavobacterium sp. UMI-01 TaxID=1441053 RepID=UPI001C7D9128|nr:DUF2279 domain-containing protein [Flavobacterium sp. UMI-01]GIZ08801.1 DUF2279 domain-containing protein [Flavobacterium sp. UMI-01]
MDWKKATRYLLLLGLQVSFSQNRINTFLKPTDSLHLGRKQTVLISEIALGTATLVGLNQLWYADYPRSKFHFINDNQEWLQMDKLGHGYSAYHLSRLGAEMLDWSGASKSEQLYYGAGLGFTFLTAIEILDGFSSQWGASVGDILANTSGTALYVTQELLWDEQRIIPKFSFQPTKYASQRPQVLGSTFTEQLLKDYNGQTYWLSINLKSFAKHSKIPSWLNLALGYGADGMLYGNKDLTDSNLLLEENKKRQFYLSLDVDLSKIKTKSHILKTFFSVFNTLKIPAPAIEFTVNEHVRVHAIHF